MSDDVTDFSVYSHSQLRTMVESLNSGDVMSASDPWRRAATTLKQIRTSLDTACGDATQKWQGNTSDAFYSAMTKLATNVNSTAAYANDAANTLQMMSEAIDQAKHDMPEEPGFWEQVGNGISDTVQNTIGVGDDSTQTPIADQRKAQAVAVMQTLANKYRTAVPVLKPPKLSGIEDPSVPPPDPTAAAALSAFVMGAGAGAIGGYATAPETRQAVNRAATASAPAPTPRQGPIPSTTARPTDSGIRGGVPNPAPKAPKSVAVGSGTAPVASTAAPQGGAPLRTAPTTGTSLDHTSLAARPPALSTGGAPSALPGDTGPTGTAPMPVGLGPNAAMGERDSHGAFDEPLTPRGGRASAGSTPREGVFTGEEEPFAGGGGRGLGGRAAPGEGVFDGEEVGMPGSRAGAGLRGGGAGGRRAGAVGEPEEPVGGSVSGAAREKAFTEGGTGLGARSRAGMEITGEPGEEGTGMPPGGAGATRRKKKPTGKRADYLVEDEETWVSGEDVNPGVVE
ncbi:PPE domain-containing protein [Kitasatospora sp. RB6PN24]|uniref:WXG100 family type VII secretion target n=1 Tax=Kitasatospora humi TaxID=2893891 RepID=UPI001E65B530|nr:WXG100 family type VII secretion target [Kitasatospora humi]MCC9308553.1 PPE domain-containing protein [Kitasatospora humi]